MSRHYSSSTMCIASVLISLASTGWAQSSSNQGLRNIEPNFYITTPQTGEQTVIGTSAANTRVVSTSRQAASSTDLNFYNSNSARPGSQTSNIQQTASSPAASTRAVIQQVSNSPARSSLVTQAQGQPSHSRVTASYTPTATQQQANTYTTQQSYPAYVSAAKTPARQTAHNPGIISKLFHGKQSASSSSTQRPVQASAQIQTSKYSGSTQSGMASWYGSDFHGGKTASGERYNMESMTAAHKSLPFGTLVQVKNERNGQECVVRINNRGPFTKGRILDLSKAAARELGMINSGVARISMKVLGKNAS